MTDSKTDAPLRLILAEDNANDAELCLKELKRGGVRFVADVVSRREDFVQKLSSPIDIVISDYFMGQWTGMDALEIIKQTCPDVPLILVTGTLGDELAVECIKAGVTDYVLKDQLGRLPMALRRARNERSLREAEKQAVEALRESEARYRGLVDNATYGVYWEKPDGTLLYANRALVYMLGYDSAEELFSIGNVGALYCRPSKRATVLQDYRNRGRIDAVAEWRRKNGQNLTVRIHGLPATDQHGQEYLEVMVEDVTERVALETQLQQAQKFEAIGQLAGGIAHDFNNMIGAILGWADMGLEETAAGSRIHRHFEKVRSQAQRAGALTRQLLAFARRQILEPRDMDLNQSVLEALSLLEKVIGGNIAVKTTLATGLPVVRADQTQLEQVLMNLCINARDAMPEGGSLIIGSSEVSFDADACKLHPLAHPGEYVMLSVTDTGAGMDAATLDRIFEPFFTTKELGKGTGLGLATVYGIVRQHGGFINVYSEPGMGTTFRVYIPVSHAAVAARESSEDLQQVQGGTETLLLVEDHEGLRQLAIETLTKLGYNVITAADGEEAIREFRHHRQHIDLALLDVVLPKLNGPEIYSRIRKVRPDIPVVFATGYSNDFALLHKVQQHGLPILQKPYTARDLARKIRETLDRNAPSPRPSA